MRGQASGQVPPMRWEDLSARAGRNDKPAILLTAIAMDVLTDPQQMRIGLEDAWTTCEWPGRAADYDVWRYAFDVAGADGKYLHEHELRDLSTLPETLPLYRAATEGHELGLSWTTSFERAHWLATRIGAVSGHPHQIFEIDAPRELVMAYFHETRGESEYVIDTSGLLDDDLRVVEPAEWEYLLERERQPVPLAHGELVELSIEESVREQLGLMIDHLASTQTGSYTLDEATELVLSVPHKLTADALGPVLEVVEDLYAHGDSSRRVSRYTIAQAVRRVLGETE